MRFATPITTAFALALSAAGCADDGSLPTDELDSAEHELDLVDVGDIGTLPIMPACTSVSPHKTLYVGPGYNIPGPPYFTNSNDSAYYYKDCGRFVADVHVGSAASQFVLSGSNFDLPSAASDDLYGQVPNNAVDCDEYRQHVTIWHKKGSGSFAELKKGSYKGVWSSGKCSLSLYSGVHPYQYSYTTAGAGWDVFRIAVQVKERRSGQSAGVALENVPPS